MHIQHCWDMIGQLIKLWECWSPFTELRNCQSNVQTNSFQSVIS